MSDPWIGNGEVAMNDGVAVLGSDAGWVAQRAPERERRDCVRTLIVGTGQRAAQLAASLLQDDMRVIVGATDVERRPDLERAAPSVRWLGPLSNIRSAIVEHSADEVCVALPLRSRFDEWQHVRQVGQELGVPVSFHLDIIGRPEWTRVETVPGLTLVRCNVHPSTGPFATWLKRVFDIVVASLVLVAVSPVLLVAAALIKITSPGPVMFKQPRVGRARRVFGMLKLRTMVPDAEARRAEIAALNDATGIMFKIERDPRLIAIGPFLRRTSIDELPQLINVLRGEMSLVGPRPIPVWVFEQIDEPSFHRRFSVLPGMTGLWQVHGRRQNYKTMAEQDLRYVDEWSLLLDLKILARTIPAVLRREGAS